VLAIGDCFMMPPGGTWRDLGHPPVADFFFGFEVSDQQTGEPLPDVGGHPLRAGVARRAGSVIDGVAEAADPPVIGHDQVRDVRLAGRPGWPGGWLV